MKSIGGFFSLELPINSKGELYPTAIKLNSGRACLEYVLRLHNYSKIYLPFYTCQVVLDTNAYALFNSSCSLNFA